MLSIDLINIAHEKVKSGADFPDFMKDLILLHIEYFEIWVEDSHSVYYSNNGDAVEGAAQYSRKIISDIIEKEKFVEYLKIHQLGQTDYLTFCSHCAETGINKWKVDLQNKTCTYYGNNGLEVLTEFIPV